MSIEHLIVFNIALLAAMASPGPALLVAIRTSLSNGRTAGISLGCGLAFMAAAWTLMALFGLNGIFKLFPWAYVVAKTIGAFYLLYIAWKSWKGAKDPIMEAPRAKANALFDGFLINLLNPKSVLFAAAVLVVIFPPDMTILEKTAIAFNQFVAEIIFYSGVSFLMSTESVNKRYLRAKVYFDRFSAVILGVLGIRLLTQKLANQT